MTDNDFRVKKIDSKLFKKICQISQRILNDVKSVTLP